MPQLAFIANSFYKLHESAVSRGNTTQGLYGIKYDKDFTKNRTGIGAMR